MKAKTKKALSRKSKEIRKRIYKAICAFFATLLCVACGTTKVSVQKPAEGTSTTITVTTNNPITTTTNPATDVKL